MLAPLRTADTAGEAPMRSAFCKPASEIVRARSPCEGSQGSGRNTRYSTPARRRTLSTYRKGIVSQLDEHRDRAATRILLVIRVTFFRSRAAQCEPVRARLPGRYSQLRWIRFACGECGKSDTACRA